MRDDMSIRRVGAVTTPTTRQTGKNNISVDNQSGATVNFNCYNYYSTNTPVSGAEVLIAVQSFCREYYQLIVTCEEDVFSNNVVTVSADRALSRTLVPNEIFDRCSTLTDQGKAELYRIPAIICRENTEYCGKTDPNQWAVFAFVKKIQVFGSSIKVAFCPIVPVNQQKLCDKRNAVFFDLNMSCTLTDLNRSAWSVHKVDIFEAFSEAGMAGIPFPVLGGCV